MESLPTEVKTQIFTSMSDLASVKSLNQVSLSFNKVFTSAKNSIIKEVVKNSLDPELLQEIVAVAASMKMKPWSKEAVVELLNSCFNSHPTLRTGKWDVSTSLAIYELQEVVKGLSADFASVALVSMCLTNQDGKTGPPPTTSELRRFERNFWKFELYCNLFRDQEPSNMRKTLPRFSPDEQKTLFLDRFAGFENEQLGCVHDYLWDQVSRAFDDVAAHDVLWGAEWLINWVDDYYIGNPNWKEALLSRGLMKIDMMRNAHSYEERYKLVQGATSCPDFDDEFLVEALLKGFMDTNGEIDRLKDLTLEQARESMRKPSYLETDDGPLEAWKWAYAEWYENCYFYSENWIFRKRAYVMWDRCRLVLWDLFETSRADLPKKYDEAYLPLSKMVEEQKKSQDARSEIYLDGGRGWWSPDDLSKVEWSDDREKWKRMVECVCDSQNSIENSHDSL